MQVINSLRSVRRRFTAALVICALCACSGCGLLYLPRIETSPGTFNRIEVRDQDTGNPIGNATIDYYLFEETIERQNGSGRPSPVAASSGEHQDLSALRAEKESEQVDFWGYVWWGGTTAPAHVDSEYPSRGLFSCDIGHLRTDRAGDGRFAVESATSLAWDHIWWPIELPLSDAVWPHIHENVIVAKAPGYMWENISFAPETARGEGGSYRVADGALIILLHRSTIGHHSDLTASAGN